ncbi:MAG TPA: HDOD domain-containing protein [Planctomycetes bacterium]|nr:HDOD domain-containing protein [Planctomycetota bacterium]
MSESGLKKALKALSVLGSVDGRIRPNTLADYIDGVLLLDTPAPYPDGALLEIFLGRPDVARGVEILGRARSERHKLLIQPVLQVDTIADVNELKNGVLPRLPDELTSPENLFAAVRKLENLPTLPAVVARILEVTISETTAAADLAGVISQDPVLSAELLRLANSAYYGLGQQVATVDRAVVVLGFNRVRMASLTIAVLRMWATSTSASGGMLPQTAFDERAFWQHCLGVAVASEALARSFGVFAGENAFVAGLFHDIGKIVLSQYLSPIYSRALIHLRKHETSIHAAEIATTGLAHERIGEWLTSSWRLPGFIRQAIEHHHVPELAGENEMAPAVVHLADVLTRTLGIGSGGDDVIPAPHATTWNRLALNEDAFIPAVKAFFKGIVNSQVFFSMMAGGGVPEPIHVLAEGGGKSARTAWLAEQVLSRRLEKDTPQARAVQKAVVKTLAAGEFLE